MLRGYIEQHRGHTNSDPDERTLEELLLGHTGVTKFSKVSLFSGLNNLNDITLDPRYATICGITQKELEDTFKDLLEDEEF